MAVIKALRGTTIVPDHLYVERAADRQLRAIVEDMGRPGYVLVARQMGKTNMLLRMKRQQEADGSIAIFIDLSTGFPSASDLFRKVVDELLEVVGDASLIETIEAEREQKKYAAGIEYDRHLRLCLTLVSGRPVIIILDEIDSLVGLEFSDRILAQIRSMYFARANHPSYNNLTYVLSGVAEPTDLIKDKNISPFNIGEKIYLDDFTLAEQNLLVRKAGLNFGHEVEEAIFDWARGNPRMTWDICSSIEDMQRSDLVVSPSDVGEVVKKLYFERFDRPPIDHIRDLAENDHSLRSSLVALLYGRGASLSDRDKSRLYLSGITTGSGNKAPSIKNRVIEEALSADWLAQVEEGKAGLLTAANARTKEKSYHEALRLYERYIAEGGSEADFEDLDLYQYGIVLHNLGRFEDSVRVLLAAISKTRSVEVRLAIRYHLGLSYLVGGSPEDAERELQLVADGSSSLYSLRAMHAMSSLQLSQGGEHSEELAKKLAETVLLKVDQESDLTDDEKKEIKSASLYNIGQAVARLDSGAEKQYLRDAYSFALPSERPFYAASLLATGSDDIFESNVAAETASYLVSSNLPYGESKTDVEFKKRHLGVLLGAAKIFDRPDIIENALLAIYKRSADTHFEAVFDAISSIKMQGAQVKTAEAALTLLTEYEELRSEAAPHRLMEAARLRDAVVDLPGAIGDREAAFFNFFRTFQECVHTDALQASDLLRLSNRIQQEISRGRLAPARAITEFVRSNREELEKLDKSVLALCIYHEIIVHRMSAEVPSARIAAKEIIELLSRRSELDVSASLTNQVQDQIRKFAQNILAKRIASPPPPRPNDEILVEHVKTGLRSKLKYKKAASGLSDGTLKRVH